MEMEKIVANGYLSTDHTFKVSKCIGIYRTADNAFVKQFENLFIILNEDREIVGWRLTKSTGHDQIKDLLEGVCHRLNTAKATLQYIIVDKCCGSGGEANFYKTIFGNDVDIKLDIFHAVQRVVQRFPQKHTNEGLAFGREFGQIFRKDGDENKEHTEDTPSPLVI